MIQQVRAWLKNRRRHRLEREARELDDLIRRAHLYTHNAFVASVLFHRQRKDYITSRQPAIRKPTFSIPSNNQSRCSF